MKKALLRILSGTLTTALLNGCEPKHVEPGIETVVTGRVFDSGRQLPVPGARLLLVEYGPSQNLFGPPSPQAIIDSARTGEDGTYSIRFRTTGNGIQYKIALSVGRNFYTNQDPQAVKAGQRNQVDFRTSRLHTLVARVVVKDNPNPPLRVYTPVGIRGGEIDGAANDTTLYLDVLPNGNNLVSFNITNPDSTHLYNVHEEEVVLIGFADTFHRTFTVTPNTFRLRR